MTKTTLIHNLSVPLNGATAVRFHIHAGDGNLSIDGTLGNEMMLASGTLEYLENQKVPAQSLEKNMGLATFTL